MPANTIMVRLTQVSPSYHPLMYIKLSNWQADLKLVNATGLGWLPTGRRLWYSWHLAEYEQFASQSHYVYLMDAANEHVGI